MDGLIGTVVAIIVGSIGTVGSVSWMIANRFSNVTREINSVKEAIVQKLEYHEGHDDERFADLTNELWRLRLVLGINDAAENDNRFVQRPSRTKVSRRSGSRKVY